MALEFLANFLGELVRMVGKQFGRRFVKYPERLEILFRR